MNVIKRLFRLWAALGAAGIILLVISAPKAVGMVMPAKDVYAQIDELKGNSHVKGEIYSVMDYYVTYSEDSREVSRVYAVAILNESDQGIYIDKIISIEKKAGDFNGVEACADNFIGWWNYEVDDSHLMDKTVSVEGTLVKLNKERMDYLTQYLKSCDYTDAEISEMVVPYAIRETSFGAQFGLTILGLIMAVIGLPGTIISLVVKSK